MKLPKVTSRNKTVVQSIQVSASPTFHSVMFLLVSGLALYLCYYCYKNFQFHFDFFLSAFFLMPSIYTRIQESSHFLRVSHSLVQANTSGVTILTTWPELHSKARHLHFYPVFFFQFLFVGFSVSNDTILMAWLTLFQINLYLISLHSLRLLWRWNQCPHFCESPVCIGSISS